MNLQKLFTAQAELDVYIEDKHPTLPGENRLEKKVLALLVELGECANEFRGFKFWSNDQEPRTTLYQNINFKKVKTNPLLEEYVDCLHFILSIGNDKGTRVIEYYDDDYEPKTIEERFINVSLYAQGVLTAQSVEYHKKLMGAFIDLGNSLGFIEEQIEQAYWTKYEINKQRQRDGY
ncbi:MAG: dUTP diphosphatase [Kurthia sp.]